MWPSADGSTTLKNNIGTYRQSRMDINARYRFEDEFPGAFLLGR
jgi:hypothetical protein